MRRLLAAVASLMLVPASAVGQCTITNTGSCSQSRPLSITINRAVEMTLSATTITLTSPAASDYTTGYAVNAGPAITVKANGAWRLNIRANAATWTGTGPLARTSKPASDLLVGTALGGPFTALSVPGFQFAAGSAATAGTVVTLFAKTLWVWTADPPGTYSLGLTFTIVAP